jgi:hypothetical protein
MRTCTCTFAVLAASALVAPSALAQTKAAPRINQVMPIGAKPGATVELAVTGQDVDDVEGLYFSFSGAKVEVLGAEKAPVDSKGKGGGGKPAPAATLQKFKVTLPPGIPLGVHDIRLVSKHGISNPRAFVIGDQNEVTEKEPNNDVPDAQKIELNTAISGVISQPADVDYVVFHGKKGQRIVVSCLASSVDSKLPAFLQIYSESGQYLGFSRNYSNNDAVADCTLPVDGAYYVRLCSFTYTQGGPDYFYRLSVTTAPWIDAVFPHIIEPGKDAKVTVLGRNLPGGALDAKLIVDDRPLEKATAGLKAPADPMAQQRLAYRGLIVPTSSGLDGFEFTMKSAAGVSNPVLINYARAPVVIDDDANDALEKPQAVQAPCEIAGRIEKKGDRDFFRFAAKKGQVLSIELFADRLGSTMDTLFTLFNGKGEAVTTQDDVQDQPVPYFLARTDDPPRYRFSVPADGAYTLMVTSKEAFLAYGPRYIYTARITPEEPDFRVIAMPVSTQTPDAVTVGQAGHQAFTLYVQRLGGFGGDITVNGDKLPPGVSVKPQVIAGNQKLAAIAVGAAPEAPLYAGPIELLATATIGGKKVTREVRAATITWPVNQQNTPTLTRLDRELVVALRDKAPYTLSVAKDQIVVPQGERITIPVKLTAVAPDFKTNVQLSAVVAPTGMAMQPVTLTPGKEGTAALDSKTTVLPGNYTLVLRGQTQPPQPNQQPKPGGPRNIIQTTPPIALTIVPKQLVKVSLPQNNVKIAPGGKAEVVVKIARIFEYDGSFKIDVDPKTAKGITALPVTLKPGDDEAKLTLSAAGDLKAGMNLSVTVRVTAMFNETVPVVHETKLAVLIGK